MRIKNFLIVMKKLELKKIKKLIKKNKEIDRYKQEIQELKEKLNDKDDTSGHVNLPILLSKIYTNNS